MNDEEHHKLDERLGRLPREIEPARELWPAIESRIRAERQAPRAQAPRRRGTWLALAAASLAVAAVALSTLQLRDGLDSPQTVPVSLNGSMTTPFGPAHNLGATYQAARAGLTDDLEERLQGLPPETRNTVLENLETIRRAAAEINAALGEDPSNLFLQHQLLAAYQDELSVLANLQRVTSRLPTRNEI